MGTYDMNIECSIADHICIFQCGHCKKLAPDWEKLAEDWSGHSVGLVAEVDCTVSKALCDANGIRGFPTLKWGDPAGLILYEGSRSLDDLQDFAREQLTPMCSAQTMNACDGNQLAQLERYMEGSIELLESKIAEEEARLKAAEEAFQTSVTKLQAEYQRILEEKDQTIAKVRESGLTLMKSVLAAKQKDIVKEEL